MVPANGAVSAFCSITAVSRVTEACAAVASARATSSSETEVTPRWRRLSWRLSCSPLRSSWAWAASTSARSIRSSIWTRRWPSSTLSLALNRISWTMPPASTPRSTPRSALAVPIASMPGVQVIGSASTTDTVTGGGCIPAKNSPIILSRKRLKPTIPPTTTTSSTMASKSRQIIGDSPQFRPATRMPADATTLASGRQSQSRSRVPSSRDFSCRLSRNAHGPLTRGV